MRDLSYRIIWKQITTTKPKARYPMSCARPKLQNNLKANHNPPSASWSHWWAVRDLSYRIIWKQITTREQEGYQPDCCARPKLQNNLKANHNRNQRPTPPPSCARPKLQNNLKANHNQFTIHCRHQWAVRDLSYRIIWKQITTVLWKDALIERLCET